MMLSSKLHKLVTGKNGKKKRILFIVGIVIFFAGAVYASLILKKDAEAAWWPSGNDWSKRQRVPLVNNSGESLAADTTVAITINTKALVDAGKLQQDCDDLRVVYQSGSTDLELSRYISFPGGATCATSEAATIYFPLQDTLSGNSTSYNYYLYYGNSIAAAPSNPDNAFDIGSKDALLVCPFDGKTTCSADETPSTATGAIRYDGTKSAISLDGSNDFITATNHSSLNLTSENFTVEAWVYIPRVQTNDPAIISRGAYQVDGWYLQITQNGTAQNVSVRTNQSGASQQVASTYGDLAFNQWNHIAFVKTGSTGSIYINGQEVTYSVRETLINPATSSRSLYIGSADGGTTNYLQSYVDEVRFSNTSRYTANFTPQTSPFIRDEYTKLLYHLDENGSDPRNSGYTLDDSGYGNHGQITGAKYISGLVGINASTTDAGKISGHDTYAGHEGIFLEEETTNKISNPSFEHATFDTGWDINQTLSLQPDATAGKDTTLDPTYPSRSYGTNPVNDFEYSPDVVMLIEFNVSSIPAAAACNSAVMSLYTYGQPKTDNLSTNIYNLTSANSDWVEGSNQNPATGGQSTWNYKSQTAADAGTAWAGSAGASTSGTDYDATVIGTINYTGNSPQYTELSTNITTSVVETWFGASNSNYGQRIKSNGFPSLALSDNSTAGIRPKFVVNYTDPDSLAENTTAPFSKFGDSSAKVTLADSTDASFYTSVNAGNTNTHTLTAYVFRATSGNVAGEINSTVAQLIFNGVVQTPTYTDLGGGWWRLSYTAAAGSGAQNYGVQINENSALLYIDGVQLEEKAYSTTYADGSLTSSLGGTDTYFWDDDCDGVKDTGEDEAADQNAQCSSRITINTQYGTANLNAGAGSISFWVKPQTAINSVTSDQYLFDMRSDDNNRISIRMDTSDDDMAINTNGTETSSSGISMDGNTWQHFILTYDFTADEYKFYQNGNGTPIISTTTSLTTPSLAATFFIGTDYNNSNHFNGDISDLRIFNSVLTSEEITDTYQVGLVSHTENSEIDRFGQRDENPIAIYHFDEGYGSVANDSSLNNNDLTISGSTWGIQPDTNRSQLVRSLKFDGTDDVASSSDILTGFNFGSGSFSISSWFKHSSTASNTDTLISQYNTAGYKVYMDSSGFVCFGIDDDNSFGDDIICSNQNGNTTSYADSMWHHIEVVKSNTDSLRLYLDGQEIASKQTLTATGTISAGSPLFIGSDTDNSNYWDGFVDELFFYPYARSTDQVKTDYLGPQTAQLLGAQTNDPLTNGLAGYWKLDESSGNAADSSGNNATLTNNSSTAYTVGNFGNAGSFVAASTDYLSAPSTINSVRTVAFWTNPSATTDEFLNLTSSAYITAASGTVSAAGFTAPDVYVNGVKDATLTASAWNHVVIISDTAVSADTFEVGRGNGAYYNGLIDDVRLYNRTLSPTEISRLYNWAPGPVGYWKMDEGNGTTTTDSSGNGNVGTLYDSPSWTTGKFGSAISFGGTGSDDAVTISQNAAINNLTEITAEAWIYPKSLGEGNLGRIFQKADTALNGRGFYVSANNSLTYYHGWSDSTDQWAAWITSANSITLNQWNHVAVTYNNGSSANTPNIYVNGILQSVTVQSASSGTVGNDSTGDLFIGNRSLAGAGYDRAFDGMIDDFRYYSYARTPAQIIEDLNAGHPAPGSPIGSALAQWKADEGFGDTLHNTGNGGVNLDGNLAGSNTCPGHSYCPSWITGGKFGRTLNYDGSNDYLEVAHNNSLSLSDFTLSTWISAQNTGEAHIIDKRGPSGSGGYALRIEGSFPKTVRLIVKEVNGEGSIVSSGLILQNTWTHLVGTFNNSTKIARIYVNGFLVKEGTLTQNPTDTPNTDVLRIGELSGYNLVVPSDYNFEGAIDEVEIYNFDLTTDQVKLLHNRGKASVWGSTSTASDGKTPDNSASREYCIPGDSTACSPPVAEWKFDENTGTAANDSSGNNYNGTLGGDGLGTDLPTWSPGKLGQALTFDGTDDYLDISSLTTTPVAATVEFWVKRNFSNDVATSPSLITLYTSWDNSFGLGYDSTWNEWDIGLTSGGDEKDIWLSADTIPINTWMHVAISWDGNNSNALKLYLNGRNHDTSETITSAWTGALSTNRIGQDIGGNNEFSGLIDDVKIYNYVRTPAQIAWDYNRGEPVAWYKFDEASWTNNCSTDTVFDSSIKTLHADSCPNTTGQTTPESGRLNNAIHFDDADDYVTSPDNNALDLTSGLSISAWINTDANEPDNVIVSKGTSYEVGINGDGDVYWENNGSQVDDTSGKVSSGTWHHIVVTNDDTTATFYVDGIRTGTSASGIGADNSTALNIGYDATNYFDGLVDDVRIYNYPITANQVKTIYNNGAVNFR